MKQVITAAGMPKAVGPFSPAIRANGFIFLSGQIGVDPASGSLVPGGFEAQLRQTLENITAILRAAGSEWAKVVKVGVFLKDLSDYPRLNEIYASVLDGVPPVRTAVQVARLPRDAAVEIDLIAAE
jgi:2-iminobutanoate/2-iminopropanoate deaminase